MSWFHKPANKPYRLVTHVIPNNPMGPNNFEGRAVTEGIRHFSDLGSLCSAALSTFTDRTARVHKVEGFKLIDGEWEPLGLMS